MLKKDFLLEIGLEELPYISQKILNRDGKDIFENLLKSKNLEYENISLFVNPTRLVIFGKNISEFQASDDELILGPPKKIAFDAQGIKTRAYFSFLEKNNILDENLVIEKEVKNAIYLAYRKETIKIPFEAMIEEIVSEFLKRIKFAKTMIWNSSKFRFIRPIRWVIGFFGDKILDFSLAGIESSNFTYLLGGYKGEKKEVLSIKNYFDLMNNEKIIIDFSERKNFIKKEIINSLGNEYFLFEDDDLLDEITSLVEYPTSLLCDFDAKFLTLPTEVIYTTLKHHQKCFAIKDKKGKLTNKFITVCNGKNKNFDLVKSGYEKVARARLKDAIFFYEKDKKKPLISRLELLKTFIYQEKLGTIYEKVKRLQEISFNLLDETKNIKLNNVIISNNLDKDTIDKILLLSKCDLLTDMTKEFPELEGIMGKYYAENDNLDPEICIALEEQYKPKTSNDSLPKTKYGRFVSIIDKIEIIVSSFLLGKKPTGSKDPFGIRRQFNGIFEILFDVWQNLYKKENDNFLLNSFKNYDNSHVDLNSQSSSNENRIYKFDFTEILVLYDAFDLNKLFSIALDNFKNKFSDEILEKTKKDLFDFIKIRLENFLLEKGYRIDIIRTINKNENVYFNDIITRCKLITEFIDKDDFINFISLYKRANNILKKASKENAEYKAFQLEITSFLPEEKNLYILLEDDIFHKFQIFKDLKIFLNTNFLIKLSKTLNDFFDKLMIMDEDIKKRNTRLKLLYRFVNIFKEFDFEELQIEK